MRSLRDARHRIMGLVYSSLVKSRTLQSGVVKRLIGQKCEIDAKKFNRGCHGMRHHRESVQSTVTLRVRAERSARLVLSYGKLTEAVPCTNVLCTVQLSTTQSDILRPNASVFHEAQSSGHTT